MQEISYSDVKLGKESDDMRTVLGWMTLDWYTFVVCVGNLTFVFRSSLLRISLFLFILFHFALQRFYYILHCLYILLDASL